MKQIHANVKYGNLKIRKEYRDRIELMRGRVKMLVGKDKLLMTMYLVNGNSFRQLARLSGNNETCMARKIRNLTRRLVDGEYITCMRHRNKFTKREMGIAKDYFMLGLSIKRIASKRRCTYYSVHQILKKIQQFVAAIEPKGAKK